MKRIFISNLMVFLFSYSSYITIVNAQPSLVPPVHLGSKTLSGFGGSAGSYDFKLQSGSTWKGDIGGINAGAIYTVCILDIDATGVTGSADRYIYFNLQDSESGSSFKHLGINFHLDSPGASGGTLFQCYQEFTSEGLSSHGLNTGVLTKSDFDLAFNFTKTNSGDPWTVTPYFRLSGGSWTLFFDGSFTASASFNFLGAKMVVGFDGGADGSVSFSDFYITKDQPISVELTSFNAFAANDIVTITWSTATETENLGFHIFRSKAEDGSYEKITQELIPGAGNSAETHTYSYTDYDVEPGNTYYYKLADVDFNGNLDFHGPVSATVAALPTEYALDQNYPNPFNPETNIRFALKEAGEVNLSIYNLQGQLVRTLESGHKKAGNYSIMWNGADQEGRLVASGVYIYKLQVNGFTATKRLVFMK